ncbi:MAG: hypothetical protein LBM03_01510 [Erysipelotrichaceae bacterium]|jgi:O-antigen/teichoic acid export membrane protein|nr:hypothetical protein [Erysipelotrichaceae bacterium]
MKKLFYTIKYGLSDLITTIKTDYLKIIGYIVVVFLGFATLYSSGSAVSTTSDSISAYLTVIASVISLVILIRKLPAPPYNLKEKLTKKNINTFISNNLGLIAIVIIELSLVIVFFITREFDSVKNYVGVMSVYMFAFLVSVVFPFDKFVKWYSLIFPVIVVISLIFYFTILITGVDFSLYSFANVNDAQYGGYIVYNSMLSDLHRNSSFFWEPGLFGSFILIGSILEISFREKTRIPILILYLIGIITTFSTACIILLIFLIPLLIIKFTKKNVRIVSLIIFVSLIACAIIFFNPIIEYLAEVFPNIFGKMITSSNNNLSTRITSIFINFQIFAKHIFGAGLKGGSEIYAEYMLTTANLNAQTSTTGMLASQLGIFGLLFFAFVTASILSKGDILKRIFILIIVFAIMNKEPHLNNVLTNMFLFYLMTDKGTYTQFKNCETIEHKVLENEKTRSLVNNLGASFVIKGTALLVGLFATPAYISYLNNSVAYGAWFTLLSLLTWILTFDLGIGNGLKNKLISAFENKEDEKAKKLISTSYIVVGIISILLLIAGNIIFQFIDFRAFFNLPAEFMVSNEVILWMVRISFFAIVLQFWLKLITAILGAIQKQAVSSFLTLITSTTMLLFVLISTEQNIETKLITLSIVNLIAVNLPLILATIVVFAKKLRQYLPKFGNFDHRLIKEILVLGGIFFIIQIALLVINMTNELLITQLFSPSYVEIYARYYKPFYVVISLATLIASPVWSAIARAFESKDFKWIKKVSNFVSAIGIALCIILALLFGLLQTFFDIWLGKETIAVNYFIALAFMMNAIILVSIILISAINNGIGALKSQVITHCIAAIAKIPFSILLVWLFRMIMPDSMAWSAIIWSNVVVLFIAPIMMYFECKKKIKMSETLRLNVLDRKDQNE